MTVPHYLAIAGQSDPFGVKRLIEERVLAAAGMRRVWSSPCLTLLSDSDRPILLDESRGVILGPVYTYPPAARAMNAPGKEESEAIAQTRCDRLIERYWGNYIAFLGECEGKAAQILRAPFGTLECLMLHHRGITLLASDLALLKMAADRTFAPDWEMIAGHLLTDGLRQARSCLQGIEELLWGERLVVSGAGVMREQAWSPWQFARQRRPAMRPETAADVLRETAIAVVGAQARDAGPLVLMLSGGLDSSILAACLAAADLPVTCLNLTTGDSTGDERAYARAVAAKLGAPLIEADHDLCRVDVTRSQAAGLVRPLARSFAQATRHAKARAAENCGARVVFDGGGGDNLFCSLQSVAPVADRLRVAGPGPSAWRTVRDMALLTQTGALTIARKAVHRAWMRSPRWRWPCDTRFLSGVAAERAGPVRHRWLDTPPGALPGAAAHVALMIAVENLLETADGALAECAPLIAQPLVELCLSLPTWLWCRDGYNRVVAREAFASRLPREVVWRRTKGTPDGFVTRLYEANREGLAELLGNGLLADQGLLDREAVLAALSQAGPVKGHDHLRLLRIADVEAWVRWL